jgi:hypothetical protein
MYCPMWVKYSIRDLHVMLLNICELCEHRGSEGNTFLYGHKCNYMSTCTVKQCDVLTVKNALVAGGGSTRDAVSSVFFVLLSAHAFLLYTYWVSLVRILAKSDVPKCFMILLLFSDHWQYAPFCSWSLHSVDVTHFFLFRVAMDPILFLVSVQC